MITNELREGDAVALWDNDQRLRAVGGYLELRTECCSSVVFPEPFIIVVVR